MAFETNILRNGTWVTRTVDFKAALKANALPGQSEDGLYIERPPCGIMSRTVIESPIVNAVQIVRLRSKWKNDIAFVGDRYVQISEISPNGQLHDVLRVTDFGARIRNSIVYGSCAIPDPGTDQETSFGVDRDVKFELPTQYEGPSTNMGENERPELPPQLLVLALETGELLFSHIQVDPATDAPRLVTTRIQPPGKISFFGHKMAIDQTNRYLAVSSMDDTLVVYLLKSREELDEEFNQYGRITPISDYYIRVLNGNIQNIAFLFPPPEDEFQTVLAMVVCPRKYKSNAGWMLLLYEWNLGDNLMDTFTKGKNPTHLPNIDEFPLILIPIKFRNALFIVYQKFLGMVNKEGSDSEYEYTVLQAPPPSEFHHGVNDPLWTAWARPYRRESYSNTTEIIYLAREDGFLLYIELDCSTLIYSVFAVGFLGTNVPRAFAAAYNSFSDLLIVCGESGPGGVWKLEARQEPERVMVLPNWSPVVDATTNDINQSWVSSTSSNRRPENKYRGNEAPDRVFLVSGRGVTGSVTELRYGIQARIGLDLELGEPVRQAWLFSDDRMESGSMVAILALPHSTAILSFSSSMHDIVVEPAEKTPFDSSSRTLYSARIISDIIVQVTEETITLVTHSQSSQHRLKELCDAPEFMPQTAFAANQFIVLSSSLPQGSELRVLRVEEMNIIMASRWETPGEDTCISLLQSSGESYILLGEMVDGLPAIAIYSMEGNLVTRQTIVANTDTTQNSQSSLEALTSIVVVREYHDYFIAIAGTRCGHLITIRIPHNTTRPISWKIERLGAASVEVFPPPGTAGSRATSALACCDNNAVRLSNFSHAEIRFKTKTAIWPTDISDTSLQVPSIHSVFGVGSYQGYNDDQSMLVMVAGTKMLLAELSDHASSISRSIPVGGTPTRIIYSDVWKCLVVAYQVEDRATIAFIDPNTGVSISKSVDKDRNPCEFISGLGQNEDKIFALQEWLYMKNGEMFPFILVTTQCGYLLVISVREVKKTTDGDGPRQLEHWTRYRKKGFKAPIYSVVGDNEGLAYCVGKILYWDVLDLAEKKLKTIKTFELDSAAVSLSISNGKIWALTSMHSLEILDHRCDPGLPLMKLLHTDKVTRTTAHMINLGSTTEGTLWPVTLLSDISGAISGVWVPWDKRNQELLVVFEGQLSNSVRRFMRARCRPSWLLEEQGRQRYGCLRNTTDGAEILGVSLDGSIRHFTLLRQDLRQFLFLIQTLLKRKAQRSVQPNEQPNTTSQVADSSKNQHIDGDVLAACLDQRSLEALVEGSNTLQLFYKHLDEIEGGLHTKDFGSNTEDSMDSDIDLGMGADLQGKYMKLGYDILEYVLAPVL